MTMQRLGLSLLALIWCGTMALAECSPAGRDTFAAGLEALNRGDLTAAEEAFNELVRAQPDCAEARNNLAVVLVEQGRLDDAAEQLRRSVELRPDYPRARFNLERVEAMRSAHRPPALAQEPMLPIGAPPAPAGRINSAGAEELTRHPPPPAEAPRPPPAQPTPALSQPSIIAALEPQGATACIIQPAQRRVCIFRRESDHIRAGDCFSMVSAQVQSWPTWLLTGEIGGQRIRFVDEKGQGRLKIIPADANVTGDAVRLRPTDLDALAAQLIPWRSSAVITDDSRPSDDLSSTASGIRAALDRWRSAWEQKQFATYVAHYSTSFAPQAESDAAHWRTRKQALFAQPEKISVQIAAPSIFVLDAGATVITVFEQWYRSGSSVSDDIKVLRWQRDGMRWVISAETVAKPHPPALQTSSAGG